ncbi:glycosyltransferase [Bacillus sp. Bva_UNVM-123]|uniref:glycosyltransferase family 2 protein n=1 Tax=Bacillus sp. Bva_UNVM-123 TaxID=2829798 RepID=UPI00391F388C
MEIVKNPLVSIIIPVYNTEKFIEEAIDSVFRQSYKNIELIVVDDASSDRSREIIERKFIEIKGTIPTYYYYFQENRGPSAARNFGVEKAKGKYIAFLDADDLYYLDKVKCQVEFLEHNPEVDIVYNDVQVVDAQLKKLNVLQSIGNFSDKETFLTNLFFRQIVPAPASMMLRKKCFEQVQYNEELIHAEDYDFLINLAKNFTFGYESGSYYICRRHDKNLTNNHMKQVTAEKKIVKKIGIDQIKCIVYSSSYHEDEQVMMLAKILIKIEEYEQARELFHSLVHIDNPYVFFYLGNLAFLRQEYENAYKYYDNAIEIDQSLAEAHNNMGCCLMMLRKFSLAHICFEKALFYRSNYLDAHYNLETSKHNDLNCHFTSIELRKQLLNYQN